MAARVMGALVRSSLGRQPVPALGVPLGLRQTPPRNGHVGNAVAPPGCRTSSSKRYNITRVRYPWKSQMLYDSWEFMKADMVNHFQTKPQRDSSLDCRAWEWPRFVMKEEILEQGSLPGMISRYGPDRRIILNKEEIQRIAFDEPEGHLSHLFKGRLFRIHVGKWIEECVVRDVSTHPVEQELFFVRFVRHVPGKMTTLPVPVTLSGLWGCPGYRKGGHVDLAMPTIDCECVGDSIPPPFLIDVSQLDMDEPYGRITIRDLKSALPADGTVRFSRNYSLDEDVVMCYDPKSIPEVPLPADWKDPNFDKRGGSRYHLTYTGFWPKQTTRS